MKRRVKRRKTAYRKNDCKTKAVSFVLIICFSVAAGYLTATYLIGPALGLETEAVFFDFLKNDAEQKESRDKKDEKEKEVVQDQLTVKSENGYALQYGSFSSMAGAEECVNDLAESDISAEIVKKDNSYKVIGEVFATREEAEESKKKLSENKEVFITEIP